jgi:hypothetical protein
LWWAKSHPPTSEYRSAQTGSALSVSSSLSSRPLPANLHAFTYNAA